jgi:hypothetical protein
MTEFEYAAEWFAMEYAIHTRDAVNAAQFRLPLNHFVLSTWNWAVDHDGVEIEPPRADAPVRFFTIDATSQQADHQRPQFEEFGETPDELN